MAELSQVSSVIDESKIVTFPNSAYKLYQPFLPAGDQPQAIAKLVEGIEDGLSYQTLLGVTGSGKTYTMANVIARLGRPAIVFAPNKTLAAQLYSEFRDFSRRTPWSISSATTITTSPKPMFRSAISSSRRIRRSTSISSRCDF